MNHYTGPQAPSRSGYGLSRAFRYASATGATIQRVADLVAPDLVRTTHGDVNTFARGGGADKRSRLRGSCLQRPGSWRGDGPGQRPVRGRGAATRLRL